MHTVTVVNVSVFALHNLWKHAFPGLFLPLSYAFQFVKICQVHMCFHNAFKGTVPVFALRGSERSATSTRPVYGDVTSKCLLSAVTPLSLYAHSCTSLTADPADQALPLTPSPPHPLPHSLTTSVVSFVIIANHFTLITGLRARRP